MNSSRSKIIDNDGQLSPWSNQGAHYNMNVYWGEVIDIAGERSLRSEDSQGSLILALGLVQSIFPQSVTQIYEIQSTHH